MTARAEQKRERAAVRLWTVAALAAAAAFAVAARDAAGSRTVAVTGPVAPDWDRRAGEADVIMVQSGDESFHVTRDPNGWIVPERGGYPVSQGAIARFDSAMRDMTIRAAKTRDPAKHARLELGDPGTDGAGVQVDVASVEGDVIATVILGKDGPDGFYVRRPADPQTYAVSGARPDIDAPSDWIDLDVLGVPRDAVVEAEVTPARGPGYTLARDASPFSEFALSAAPEGWRLQTVGAGATVGGAAEELAFRDVRRATDFADAAPFGVHQARTVDGLVVRAAVYAEDDVYWAVLAAEAAAPAPPAEDGLALFEPADADDPSSVAEPGPEGPAEPAADAGLEPDPAVVSDAELLNARVEGWAYRLPPFAHERLLRPLEEIAEREPDPEPEPDADVPDES